MEKVTLIARYLLALMLLVFGANKFLHFMPMPDYQSGSPPMLYMIGLSQVPLFPILGIIYIVSAVLLVLRKMVGLVTVILSAIAFNILLFHLSIDPGNIPAGIVLTVLIVLVMIGNKEAYRPLLK